MCTVGCMAVSSNLRLRLQLHCGAGEQPLETHARPPQRHVRRAQEGAGAEGVRRPGGGRVGRVVPCGGDAASAALQAREADRLRVRRRGRQLVSHRLRARRRRRRVRLPRGGRAPAPLRVRRAPLVRHEADGEGDGQPDSRGGEAVPRVAWLRYNPHTWHVDGVLQRALKVQREKWLCAHLATLTVDAAPLTIGYAFYDTSSNGVLDVVLNDEFHPAFVEVTVDLTAAFHGQE